MHVIYCFVFTNYLISCVIENLRLALLLLVPTASKLEIGNGIMLRFFKCKVVVYC